MPASELRVAALKHDGQLRSWNESRLWRVDVVGAFTRRYASLGLWHIDRGRLACALGRGSLGTERVTGDP